MINPENENYSLQDLQAAVRKAAGGPDNVIDPGV